MTITPRRRRKPGSKRARERPGGGQVDGDRARPTAPRSSPRSAPLAKMPAQLMRTSTSPTSAAIRRQSAAIRRDRRRPRSAPPRRAPRPLLPPRPRCRPCQTTSPPSRCISSAVAAADAARRAGDQDALAGEFRRPCSCRPAVLPPSIATAAPVMKAAAGEARQRTKAAISSGAPAGRADDRRRRPGNRPPDRRSPRRIPASARCPSCRDRAH